MLADVGEVDAVITDPPYGARTHSKQQHGRRPEQCRGEYVSSRGIGYACLTPEGVDELSAAMAVARGWVCLFTSHDLVDRYTDALERAGRYVFAPLAAVQRGMNVRLAGDGPSNWTTWIVVSRPRTGPIVKWGTLPGAYVGNPFDPGENSATRKMTAVVGSKPLWLMRALVRDYSRLGDLICDPCAGSATTLIAAAIEGRRAIGAEMCEETFRKAAKRISAGYTVSMFNGRGSDRAKASGLLFPSLPPHDKSHKHG